MTVNNKPSGETGNQMPNLVNIREFFTLWLTNVDHFLGERDRRYDERYVAQEKAVLAALAAQEKLTSAAFASAEKAVAKAEDAQKDYNQRSNEFRGQLDDQAKTLMPRTEVVGMFGAIDKRLEDRDKTVEQRIAALETFRYQNEGKTTGAAPYTAIVFSVIGSVLSALAVGAVVIATRQ